MRKKRGRIIHQVKKRRSDVWLAVFASVFTLFGIVMIFEASNVSAFRDFGDKYYYIREQLSWFVIGCIGMLILSRVHYKTLQRLSIPLLVASLLSLFSVFLPGIGRGFQGAHRWVGIGPLLFQPSEFAKLALLIYLSSWLGSLKTKRFPSFLLLLTTIVGLVILQPDLGTAIILMILFVTSYFLSGAPLWHIGLLLPLIFFAGISVALTSSYRLSRILTFLNIQHDPLGASYHIQQALIAFGSGGFWGVGLGASRQKYQYLPEATTDSIFAIIGEEFGFVGSLLCILFFLAFLLRIFRVAYSAPDRESTLLAGGILTLFGMQIAINLGSMVALFPLTGVPLPFISYGGSSLVVSFLAVGILLNISQYIPDAR